MGGTLFTGMTCSALTAGVMALGMRLGEVENSRARVLRMIGTMAVGGDAAADELNSFNPVLNLGHKLARWFKREFGSTQCRAVTGCDFASATDVRAYIATDGTASCRRIAERVAARVAELVEEQSNPDNTQEFLTGRRAGAGRTGGGPRRAGRSSARSHLRGRRQPVTSAPCPRKEVR
jgi:hypothetical protein